MLNFESLLSKTIFPVMLNVAMTGLCKHKLLSLETRPPETTTQARRHGEKSKIHREDGEVREERPILWEAS